MIFTGGRGEWCWTAASLLSDTSRGQPRISRQLMAQSTGIQQLAETIGRQQQQQQLAETTGRQQLAETTGQLQERQQLAKTTGQLQERQQLAETTGQLQETTGRQQLILLEGGWRQQQTTGRIPLTHLTTGTHLLAWLTTGMTTRTGKLPLMDL